MGLIFSRRNVLGTIIITCLILVCTVITAIGLYGECVTNYSNLMPIYEGAEIIESESSLLNYLGLGNLRTVWLVADNPSDVQQWYANALADQRRAAREAERDGEKPQPLWSGEVSVDTNDNGTRIQMQSTCF